MFRALWIAAGVGVTIYCFMTAQPRWLCIANVVLDVYLVLSFISDRGRQ